MANNHNSAPANTASRNSGDGLPTGDPAEAAAPSKAQAGAVLTPNFGSTPERACETVHPDAEMITACVNFAVAMRGASGAFEVDPTGDNDFAQAADGKLLKRARKELHFIANYLPSTPDGLRAKGAVIDMAIELDDYGLKVFLKSLADDVKRFHRAAVAAKTNDVEIPEAFR